MTEQLDDMIPWKEPPYKMSNEAIKRIPFHPTEDIVERIEKYVNESSDSVKKPLIDEIENAYRNDSTLKEICNEIAIEGFQHAMLFGSYIMTVWLTKITNGDNEPTFELFVDNYTPWINRKVKFTLQELFSFDRFQIKICGAFHFLPFSDEHWEDKERGKTLVCDMGDKQNIVKPYRGSTIKRYWHGIIEARLNTTFGLTIRTCPAEMTEEGETWERIIYWIENVPCALDIEELDYYRALHKEEASYFKAKIVKETLRRTYSSDVPLKKIWDILRDHGIKETTVRIGDKTAHAWMIPVNLMNKPQNRTLWEDLDESRRLDFESQQSLRRIGELNELNKSQIYPHNERKLFSENHNERDVITSEKGRNSFSENFRQTDENENNITHVQNDAEENHNVTTVSDEEG